MFKRKGYDAEVWEEPRTAQLVVSVSKGEDYQEAHSYDMPGANAELSPKLKAWIAELP